MVEIIQSENIIAVAAAENVDIIDQIENLIPKSKISTIVIDEDVDSDAVSNVVTEVASLEDLQTADIALELPKTDEVLIIVPPETTQPEVTEVVNKVESDELSVVVGSTLLLEREPIKD